MMTMGDDPEDQREVRRKKSVIEYAEKIGHVGKACRRFRIARSTFHLWRDRYRESGDEAGRVGRRAVHTLRYEKQVPGHHVQVDVKFLTLEHVYIKPRTPQLRGKVERSHRTDKDEFYQLLTYQDDTDFETKLGTWESFYNNDRPHGAHKGKTPYEVLKEKLSHSKSSSLNPKITQSGQLLAERIGESCGVLFTANVCVADNHPPAREERPVLGSGAILRADPQDATTAKGRWTRGVRVERRARAPYDCHSMLRVACRRGLRVKIFQ